MYIKAKGGVRGGALRNVRFSPHDRSLCEGLVAKQEVGVFFQF